MVEGVAELELRFETDKADASVVRRFLAGHYEHVFSDDDLAARIAMAAHELIENATKYASNRRARLRIERGVDDQNVERVALSITNAADALHARRLADQLREMDSFPDAATYYHMLMRRAAKRQGGPGGLGLARIRAEGEMKISYALDGNDLSVRAELQVERRVA